MNHRKSGRKLGRTSDQRKAMFQNMSISLLEHGMIVTTLPKAKELRRFVEPIITRSGTDTLANKRLVFSRLRSKKTTHMLFSVIGPHFKKRPGGYLRILKKGYRDGDGALMAIVQLVDYQPPAATLPASTTKKVTAATTDSKVAEVQAVSGSKDKPAASTKAGQASSEKSEKKQASSLENVVESSP